MTTHVNGLCAGYIYYLLRINKNNSGGVECLEVCFQTENPTTTMAERHGRKDPVFKAISIFSQCTRTRDFHPIVNYLYCYKIVLS